MFQLLLAFLLKLVATVVQIVCIPINAIINATMPNLSDKILYITSNINTLFSGFQWVVGLLPPIIIESLLFILTIELAFQIIIKSVNGINRVYTILQKIKFW